MISAAEARKITEAKIDTELAAIDKEIQQEASRGGYKIDHRLPLMDSTQRMKLITRLRAQGFEAKLTSEYDQPIGYGWYSVAISWEEK